MTTTPNRDEFPARVIENGAYLDFARRIIRRAGERIGDADPWALADLVSLRADLDAAIRQGVDGLKREGYSWADIARPLGITRSAAHEQYGPRRTTPTVPGGTGSPTRAGGRKR